MSQFAHEDFRGDVDFVSDGNVTVEADRNQDGVGDLVFRTAGVERARIKHDGTGSGWANVLGGSITAVGDVVLSADTGATGTGDVVVKTDGAVERLRLKNAGSLLFTPATDARVLSGSSFSWSASHVFPYGGGNKDGLFYIDGFTDNGGSASPVTYSKPFGVAATKVGHGNMDGFWASITHKGDGEAGLFIGDVTADASGSGGNLWGGHFQLNQNIASNAYALRLEFNPSVDVSSKTQIGLEILNNNASNQITQGLRTAGSYNRHIICYSNSNGSGILFDLDNSGNVRANGNISPIGNGLTDFGNVSNRWRTLYVNNIAVNGADSAGSGGGVAIHNSPTPPTGTPASGGVAYVSSGVLRWADSAGTDVALNRSSVVSKTGSYTVSLSDSVILADASGGAVTVTLPTPVGIVGMRYTVKRISSGANAVTIATAAGLIDGSSTVSLAAQWDAVTVISDGVNWNIIADRPSALGL